MRGLHPVINNDSRIAKLSSQSNKGVSLAVECCNPHAARAPRVGELRGEGQDIAFVWYKERW